MNFMVADIGQEGTTLPISIANLYYEKRNFHRQYDLNPARCHLITVSGFTIAKAQSSFGERYKPVNI